MEIFLSAGGFVLMGLFRAWVGYEIIIYWSQEDEAFIAEVPDSPGCAADGQSPVEALENIQVIIDEWIEAAREMGS